MTQKEIEKYFNYLNNIYYVLYEAHLVDKITDFEWDKTKQNIWELKDTLKNAKK